MTDKFQHKYRIPSTRLSHWDYGSNAMYFVTICTKQRECYFGDVVDDKTRGGGLDGGLDVETPNLLETPKLGVSTADPPPPANPRRTVPSQPAIPHHTTPSRAAHASQKWNPGILGVIINQYKRMVTIRARKIHADFGWQSRFHDHIIRNDTSLQQIRKYIRDNPGKWKDDSER